jgi:hypothetical protein
VITLLPAFHETIVLPRKAEEVFHLLEDATSNKPFIQSDEQKLFFNGWVREDKFRVSLRVHRANNYLPLVVGQLEPTSSGSILLVDYKLFPTTRLLLVLWTIILILGSIFISFQTKNILYLLGGACIIILIHAIVWSNFNLQLKPTREALHSVLS